MRYVCQIGRGGSILQERLGGSEEGDDRMTRSADSTIQRQALMLSRQSEAEA